MQQHKHTTNTKHIIPPFSSTQQAYFPRRKTYQLPAQNVHPRQSGGKNTLFPRTHHPLHNPCYMVLHQSTKKGNLLLLTKQMYYEKTGRKCYPYYRRW